MPNSFTTSHNTHGVLENNQIDARVQSGSIFEAPSDWTIYLIYNKQNSAGAIRITSSVQKYTKYDLVFLDHAWKPTKTSYEGEDVLDHGADKDEI